ncbi:hypothetical protein EIN_410750 [Entamoeba invadens IP1]|uniref:Uncharacterized protein n=1 Tax=Entamoeba invadens IP1 TaxID=370355 RepID=A0A0A1U111_ENTIV|nr:hypothetical protein EIN_410750 [Entamoeba invadens IP1]ELP87732.1 hypothetical protein EIN_410750 [Entamoeba invadens IP1]|eukprot:XP_004254503.1 hypothetical protein EIN_410750 [Entamoeba invadens IP1]
MNKTQASEAKEIQSKPTTTPNRLLKQKENTKTALHVAFMIALMNWCGCCVTIHKRKRTAMKSMQYFDVAEISGPTNVTSKEVMELTEMFEMEENKKGMKPAAMFHEKDGKNNPEKQQRHHSKSERSAMFNLMMTKAQEVCGNKVVFSKVKTKRALMTLKRKVFGAVMMCGKAIPAGEVLDIAKDLHTTISELLDENRQILKIDGKEKEVLILHPHEKAIENVWKRYEVPPFATEEFKAPIFQETAGLQTQVVTLGYDFGLKKYWLMPEVLSHEALEGSATQ